MPVNKHGSDQTPIPIQSRNSSIRDVCLQTREKLFISEDVAVGNNPTTDNKLSISSLKKKLLQQTCLVSPAVYELMSVPLNILVGLFLSVAIVINMLNVMVYIKGKKFFANAVVLIAMSVADAVSNAANLSSEMIPEANLRRNTFYLLTMAFCGSILPNALHSLANVLMALMSLERFLTVRNPLNPEKNLIARYQKTVVAIGVIIVAGFGINGMMELSMSPPFTAANNRGIGNSSNQQTANNTNVSFSGCCPSNSLTSSVNLRSVPRSVSLVRKVLLVYTMMTSTSVLNCLTVHRLKKESANRRSLGHLAFGSLRRKAERQMTIVLITITSIYVIFVLPRTTMDVAKDVIPTFKRGKRHHYLFLICIKVGKICEGISTASDFIVFSVMNRRFRRILADSTCCARK